MLKTTRRGQSQLNKQASTLLARNRLAGRAGKSRQLVARGDRAFGLKLERRSKPRAPTNRQNWDFNRS